MKVGMTVARMRGRALFRSSCRVDARLNVNITVVVDNVVTTAADNEEVFDGFRTLSET